MGISYEDSVVGGTDISGDPPPTLPPTPGEIAAATRGTVQHTQRGPQVQGNRQGRPKKAQPPASQPSSGGEEDATLPLSSPDVMPVPMLQQPQKLVPIQWDKQDPHAVYWAGKWAYDGITNFFSDENINRSVHHVYNSDDVWSNIIKGAFDVVGGIPGIGWDVTDLPALLQGRWTDEQAASHALRTLRDIAPLALFLVPGAEEFGAAGAAGDVAEGTTEAASMARTAAKAAGSAYNTLLAGQQILQPFMEEPNTPLAKRISDTVWAVIGAAMLYGHVPSGASSTLRQLLRRWPEMEAKIQAALGQREQATRTAAAWDPTQAIAKIDDILNRPMGMTARLLAKNKPANQITIGRRTYQVEGLVLGTGEHGEKTVRMTQGLPEPKALKNLYRRLGIKGPEEFVQRVLENPIPLSKQALSTIRKFWSHLNPAYPLYRFYPEEKPPNDPRLMIDQLSPELQPWGHRYITGINAAVDLIQRGIWANEADPYRAILRSLAGYSTAAKHVSDYLDEIHARLLAGHEDTEAIASKIQRATEGDEEAYADLPAEAKMIADGWGILRAALRLSRKDIQVGPKKFHVPNYAPRTAKFPDEVIRGRGRPSGTQYLVREAAHHRAEALKFADVPEILYADPKWVKQLEQEIGDEASNAPEVLRQLYEDTASRIVVTQAHQYTEEATAANRAARREVERFFQEYEGFTGDVLLSALGGEKQEGGAKGLSPLWQRLANDPAAHKILNMEPGAERDRAVKAFAYRMYPDFETNFLVNFRRAFRYEMRDLAARQAVESLTKMYAKDKRPLAVYVPLAEQRRREQLLREGYQPSKASFYGDFLFHPEMVEDLNRYIDNVARGGLAKNSPLAKGLIALENKMVSIIMFSPLLHGLNVAGRFFIAAMLHPLSMLEYFSERHELRGMDREAWELAHRLEAYDAGFQPYRIGQSPASQLLNQLQDRLGDVEDYLPPPESRLPARLQPLADRLKNRPRPMQPIHDKFWGMVTDFGVMMYHLEKRAARSNPLLQGSSEEAIREYAARRAMSWMGMVAPEDSNPLMHDLARLVFFAPNWMRTWVELLLPIYRRTGFGEDDNFLKYRIYQSAKTMMAAFAFQKMSGNALNYLFSGHSQFENQPGNQDKIEITQPWAIESLQAVGVLPTSPWTTAPDGTRKPNLQYIDPKTGENPWTGARYTMENPLARQQYQTESLLGLESGQPGWQPSFLEDGITRTLASHLSPLVESMSALLNIDAYRSLATHQFRAVDPTKPLINFSPENVLYFATMMTPAGSYLENSIEQSLAQGDVAPSTSISGTTVPQGLRNLLGGVKDATLRTIFTMLTGVNPPYVSAQKTEGLTPSDADYQKLREAQQTYEKQMNQLSTEALSGQITPSQWRQAYTDLARSHAAYVSAIYDHAPEYVKGAEGLANDWEALYSDPRVLQPDGTIDFDMLTMLQQQFLQSHDAEQIQQMQALLAENEQRYPMLKLYHDTINYYHQWQEEWARQQGIQINELRKEIGEYSQTYGDVQLSRRYLAQHPQLARYEYAKRFQFERTEGGMLYALFYDQNGRVLNYLKARGLTEEEFVKAIADIESGNVQEAPV